MAIMMVVILIAFFTVVAVLYLGSKEDLHDSEHLSVNNSRATATWIQRAQTAEAKRQRQLEGMTQTSANSENA